MCSEIAQSRERFEKWARGPKLPLKRDGILYCEYMTQLAWMAWERAIAESQAPEPREDACLVCGGADKYCKMCNGGRDV